MPAPPPGAERNNHQTNVRDDAVPAPPPSGYDRPMTTLPDSLTAALPSRERRCPALALADGRWLAAARAGLYVFPAPSPSEAGAGSGEEGTSSGKEAGAGSREEAGAGSGEAADAAGPALFPWYDVARARWEAEGELFALEWVDPSRRPLTGRTEGDPEQFMRHAGEYVDRSIVLHAQCQADNGTTITAWVRRGGRGLFSVLTASGPLDAAGRRAADALEAGAREAVGLD